MDQTTPIQTQYTGLSPFTTALNKSIFHGESEKSFVDKVLGRQDADKLHELIKKEPLTLSDVEEILFLMTSIDQKLLNYNEWDRYIIVKLFPWIKDFSIICKQLMIYEQQYKEGDFDNDFSTQVEIVEEIVDKIFTGEDLKEARENLKQKGKRFYKPVLEETKKIIEETNKIALHYFKFLISTFLLVSNTTLSIDGAAFNTITTAKYEYSYPSMQIPQPQERRSILNVFKTKR